MYPFRKYVFSTILILICLSSLLFCWEALAADGPGSPPASSGPQQLQDRPGASQPGSLRPGQPVGRPDGKNRQQPSGKDPSAASASGAEMEQPVLIGAVLFFIAAVAAYILTVQKKIGRLETRERQVILILLGSGLLARLVLAQLMTGHPYDMGLFARWADAAASNLGSVYSSARLDYPPLYIYVLYLVGKAQSLPACSSYSTVILKLPAILADLATSYLIFSQARKRLSPTFSIILGAFYLFNPAVLINSSLWGQVDSFFTCLLVGALILLSQKKASLASILFAAAVLMKPQGIIFLPVLFFELVRQKNWKEWLKSLSLGLATAVLVVLPFAWRLGPLWIFELYMKTLGEYPFASVNAFNLFSLLGANYTRYSETLGFLSYQSWGMIFIVTVTVLCWFLYARANTEKMAWAAALLLISGVFTLGTGMHERYLFPALALSIFAYIYFPDKRFLFMSGGFSASIFFNTYAVLFATIKGVNSIGINPYLIITALLNISLLAYLVKVLLDIAVFKKPFIPEAVQNQSG